MQARPPGEPAALEAVSAQLSSCASRLDELAAGVPGLLPASVFIGPARAEHDGEFGLASSRAKAAAHTLKLEATSLAREAGVLRERQRDWDLQKKAEDDRKHAAAEKAAGQCIARPIR